MRSTGAGYGARPASPRGAATKTVGWSWGIPELEELIGPLSPGRLYVIGARPSNGKTAVAMHLVLQVVRAVLEGAIDADRQPWKVLAWFTERSRHVAIKSLAALHLGLDEDAVLRSAWDKLPSGAKETIDEQTAVLGDLWPGLVFADRMSPTLADLQHDVAHFVNEDGSCQDEPEILVLDYLQKVRGEQGQTHFDAMREVIEWLRFLAGEGKTVVVGSQLKRRGDGVFDKYRPPHLEDFYGGGLIEATAEVALGLFRPLRRMTHQQMRDVREGRAPLAEWTESGVMAIKCLKHSYLGPAADGIVRARIAANRRITPYGNGTPVRAAPAGAGDAWEELDDDVPF